MYIKTPQPDLFANEDHAKDPEVTLRSLDIASEWTFVQYTCEILLHVMKNGSLYLQM